MRKHDAMNWTDNVHTTCNDGNNNNDEGAWMELPALFTFSILYDDHVDSLEIQYEVRFYVIH